MGAAVSMILVMRLNIAWRRVCLLLLSGTASALERAAFSSPMNVLWMSVLCQYAPMTARKDRARVETVDGFVDSLPSFPDEPSLLVGSVGRRQSNTNASIGPST